MIIGISGKIGSGKDTAAGMIAVHLREAGVIAVKKSYAYNLKKVVEVITGFRMKRSTDKNFQDIFHDYTQEQKNQYLPEFKMTVGEMLQKAGTEFGRDAYYENVWVDSVFRDYHQGFEKDVWVITDVRFPNEAEKIKKMKGLLLRIEGDPNKVQRDSLRKHSHSSETALDDYKEWDAVIDNNNTMDALRGNLYDILKLYKFIENEQVR